MYDTCIEYISCRSWIASVSLKGSYGPVERPRRQRAAQVADLHGALERLHAEDAKAADAVAHHEVHEVVEPRHKGL